MSLTVPDVAEQLRETNQRLTESNDRLTAAIHGLEVEVAKINNSLSFLRWIGVTLVAIGLGVLTFSYGAVRKATQIEDAVTGLQKDSAELRNDFKARDNQFSKAIAELRNDFKARDDQFSKALERIEKALAQNQPARSKQGP
jgi:erythromycin esterase-like protein